MMSDYNDPWGSVLMDASHLSSDEASNPKPMDTFSELGNDSCGEPLVAQHIHNIDFTPNDDDNGLVQNKVCFFWQFIFNQPHTQNLKVMGGKCEAHAKPSKRKVVKPEDKVAELNKTACENLDMVDKKDLLTRAVFHERRPYDLVLIKEDEDIQQKKRAYQTPVFWSGTMHKHWPVKKPAPSKAKKLCTKLQEWDDKHPKSIYPPGHAPSIQPCVIQKQVFEF